MVDGRRHDLFILDFFGSVGGRGFLAEPTLLANLLLFTNFTNTDFINFQPTLTLPTAVRFEMRNKIKFGGISRLINRFYRLCWFGMLKLKFLLKPTLPTYAHP
jgi:hypothetical protein